MLETSQALHSRNSTAAGGDRNDGKNGRNVAIYLCVRAVRATGRLSSPL